MSYLPKGIGATDFQVEETKVRSLLKTKGLSVKKCRMRE